MTVIVTDVDEAGEVVISLLQPEVEIVIMASLTDPDEDVTSESWKWAVSEVATNLLDKNNEDHWGDAPGDQNQNSYTPDGSDEGKFLRVTASYTGEDGLAKTVHAMSAYPVQAQGLGEKNQSPDFDGDKVELSVAETAEVGDDVPGPVVATVVAPLRDRYTNLRAAHFRCW